MKYGSNKWQIISILEPALCESCRFAAIATVEMADGSSRRLLHCKRLDCDNWQTQETDETPRHVYDGG